MTDGHLSLIVARGERAVCHTIDPAVPAAEIPTLLGLYLGGAGAGRAALVWLSDDGPRPLEPDRPIGEQVPEDAEIEIRPVRA